MRASRTSSVYLAPRGRRRALINSPYGVRVETSFSIVAAPQFTPKDPKWDEQSHEAKESYFHHLVRLFLGPVDQGSTACPKNRKYRVDPTLLAKLG